MMMSARELIEYSMNNSLKSTTSVSTSTLSRNVEVRSGRGHLLFTYNPVESRLCILHKGEMSEIDIECLRRALLSKDVHRILVDALEKEI